MRLKYNIPKQPIDLAKQTNNKTGNLAENVSNFMGKARDISRQTRRWPWSGGKKRNLVKKSSRKIRPRKSKYKL
jgi:hypothetical protein